MRNTILSIVSLILVFLWVLPSQGASSGTDSAKLLASLNSKTAKLKAEWLGDKKPDGTITRELGINSYVFSLDRKLLKITFTEEIQTFETDKHLETYSVVGLSSVDTGQLDLQKIEINNGMIDIFCQDKKRCINTEEQNIEYNARDEKTTKKSRINKGGTFHIRGASLPVAEQISKDLKDLFALLVPTKAKPVEQPVTAPAAANIPKP